MYHGLQMVHTDASLAAQKLDIGKVILLNGVRITKVSVQRENHATGRLFK